MFIAEVTVEEQLMFSARLRMPKNATEDERKETVENLITSMGLISCRYSRIGTATEKFISKSERKRLAFASEIITNPSILFCDEPTSGLDSFMALQVIAALKILASKAKTVISTIHQPSTEVYQMADRWWMAFFIRSACRIILLANGHVAYQGGMDGVEKFFTSLYCRRITSETPDLQQAVNDEAVDFSQSIEDSPLIPFHSYHYRSDSRNSYQIVPGNPTVRSTSEVQVLSLILGCVYYQVEFTKDSLMNYKGSAMRASLDMVFIFLYPCISVSDD
ncbi:unnamed protein product [Angiostrongylus costaricensis]|uniref:ABC transporter domain-containing protein n=1 Tax=Angiostrongylus costaricensis TaxID=334426 RepID=A0A0R3PNE1_ANGCS|nr:unnamed protein product [Angiostrongylus costaricensis]